LDGAGTRRGDRVDFQAHGTATKERGTATVFPNGSGAVFYISKLVCVLSRFFSQRKKLFGACGGPL
jgi:hypothetical protein